MQAAGAEVARHFAFNADERFLPIYQFADEANNKITQLEEFADKFLVKCTLGQTISRYMVLVASEQKLLMMRPLPSCLSAPVTICQFTSTCSAVPYRAA